MSGFDYRHTCPIIDKAIDSAKEEIESAIDNMLDEACPLFDGKAKREYVIDQSNALYSSLEHLFESVRDSNVDMRDAADEQITELENKIAELEARIEELEKETT